MNFIAEKSAALPGPAQGDFLAEDPTVDLGFYFRTLLAQKRTIAIFGGVALLLGILYLHVATQIYTVTLKVTPVESSSGATGGGGLAGLAGLASAAGVTLPNSQGEHQLDLYLAALNSPTVSQVLLKDPVIAKTMFSDSWDDAHQTWKEPASVTKPLRNAIKGVLGFNVQPWRAPSPQDLSDIIAKTVVVDHKPTSPIVTITYENRDPQFARHLLGALHAAADEELRERAISRATAYIAYLTDELKSVTSNEQREALINTLSHQEALRMAAGANISYSVDVFSPPTASSKPTSPQSILVLLASLISGFLAGVVYVLFRHGSGRGEPGSNTSAG